MPDIGPESERFKIVRNRRGICPDDHREATRLDSVEHHTLLPLQLLQFQLAEFVAHPLALPAYHRAFVVSAEYKFIPLLRLPTSATGPAYEMLLQVLRAYSMCIHYRVNMRFENVVELAAHPEPLHTRST